MPLSYIRRQNTNMSYLVESELCHKWGVLAATKAVCCAFHQIHVDESNHSVVETTYRLAEHVSAEIAEYPRVFDSTIPLPKDSASNESDNPIIISDDECDPCSPPYSLYLIRTEDITSDEDTDSLYVNLSSSDITLADLSSNEMDMTLYSPYNITDSPHK